MTTLEQNRRRVAGGPALEQRPRGAGEPFGRRGSVNVGNTERTASVAAGTVLAALGLSRRSLPGLLVAGIGGAMLYRGATGHSHTYGALGINTARARQPEELAEEGIHVQAAFLINKPAEELYRYWRDFRNLPRIMTYLERVDVIDERRSHWVARAPKLAGGTVEWDAEITRDEPNSVIGWRSLPNADVDNAGEIRFSKAMGDRGTEVRVTMDYVPPAGRIGHVMAAVLGQSPRHTVREDLRNFKRIMETGEVITIVGQPTGTCLGVGKYYRE